MKKTLLSLAAVALLAPSGLVADDWGTVTGKIVLKGEVPAPVLLHAKDADIKDKEVCAAFDTYKDDLVIDADTKGIANVLIYLSKAPKKIHPDSEKPDLKVVFDQKNCVFKPHVLVVRAGQSVEVLNSDTIAHNTHTSPVRNQGTNILIAPETVVGNGVMIPTNTREIVPHPVKCDYHPWMVAYWLVVDHPYAAATDAQGNFTIKNLPVGEHECKIWHERAGYLDRKYMITVKAGDNKLKPVEVNLSDLAEK